MQNRVLDLRKRYSLSFAVKGYNVHGRLKFLVYSIKLGSISE